MGTISVKFYYFFYCFKMLLNVLYFSCRALCGSGNNGNNKKSDDLAEKKPDEISKLDVKFFSFTTFYYMVLISSDWFSVECRFFKLTVLIFLFLFFNFQFQMFLAMSAAGTKFHGYFFAFHLLNIVNNNQLLSGVIKAVTLNGNPIIFQVVQYSRVSISGGCWFWLTLTVRKKVAELYAKFAPFPISYWFARF